MEDWRDALEVLVDKALSGTLIETKDLIKTKELMEKCALEKERMSPFERCVEETVIALNALSNIKI